MKKRRKKKYIREYRARDSKVTIVKLVKRERREKNISNIKYYPAYGNSKTIGEESD